MSPPLPCHPRRTHPSRPPQTPCPIYLVDASPDRPNTIGRCHKSSHFKIPLSYFAHGGLVRPLSSISLSRSVLSCLPIYMRRLPSYLATPSAPSFSARVPSCILSISIKTSHLTLLEADLPSIIGQYSKSPLLQAPSFSQPPLFPSLIPSFPWLHVDPIGLPRLKSLVLVGRKSILLLHLGPKKM